ncbi:hypothetical protein SOV_22980 [Sporomusa ovata DSM 2662]|uniref:Phage protein n=1 Tax=Sporomusa ovata TaxID=2378 RepID=A0A0U1L398_9FIRM|nr:hypothetical protein [Sporomusa ovata]EQB25614.1 hypothetical protein SOV_4c02770 [Sporomusa ovata DSM 2662]CQR74171.1 hypothetical protein SpAn4DRAFT_0633 [Sporomusa ovata]
MNGQNYGWANALADVLSTAITKNAQDKQYQQGLDYISQQEAQNKALVAAQQDYTKTQDWYAQANKILSLNKDWANYQAQGLDNNDPRMQKIITDSQAVRQYGQQKGYNLPGQDVPYGNIQGFIDLEGNARIAKIADQMKKSGYAAAGQFVRPSDMGHDVGPTQAPTYNLDTSLTGLGDYIKQSQAENNSPLSLMTGMAKLNISPEVMQKLAPLYNAYMKSNNDQEAIALLGQYQTEPDPVKKAQIIQQYYNLIGKDGLGFLKDLTPQQKAVQWNNGGQQGIDVVTMPSQLGTGGAGVTNLQNRNNTFTPGQVLQGQISRENLGEKKREFDTTTSQNDSHFWATYNKPSITQGQKSKDQIGTIMKIIDQEEKAYADWAKNPVNMDKDYPRQQQLDSARNVRSQFMDGITGQNSNSQSQNNPIAAWIDRARQAGADPEQIKKALHDKGYGDTYDSWVW